MGLRDTAFHWLARSLQWVQITLHTNVSLLLQPLYTTKYTLAVVSVNYGDDKQTDIKADNQI